MLIDHRTYTVKPGTLSDAVALYHRYGFEVQKRYLGEPLAFMTVNQEDKYVHLWIYQDAEDRERKRAALQKDPAWQQYIEKNDAAGHLLKQDVVFMTPTAFAPIQR